MPLVFIALTIFALVPIWAVRIHPMLQAPADMAMARVWHSVGDPAFKLARYYDVPHRFYPGIFYYAAMDLLLYVVRIQIAQQILLSLYVLAFPLATWSLAKALGRSPWLALCSFLLIFNRNWIFGYTGFLLGSAACVYAWARAIEFLDDATSLRLVMLTAWGGLLYLLHPLALLLFFAGEVGLVLGDGRGRRSLRRGLSLLLAALPWLLLLAAVALGQVADPPTPNLGDLDLHFLDLPALLVAWPSKVLSLFPGALDYNFLWILIGTVAVLWWRDGRARPPGRLIGLMAGAAAAYVFLPSSVDKPFSLLNLGGRCAPTMALLFTLVPALPPTPVRRATQLAMIPLVVASAFLPMRLLALYISFDARNGALVRLLHDPPRGASTLVVYRGVRTSEKQLDESGDVASAALVYRYFVDLPTAISGGYAPELLEVGAPVVVRHRLKTPGPIIPDDINIRLAPEYDYYLVRCPSDALQREPALKMIDELGDWTLFRRQYDLSEEP